jgi:hypothetical protein
MVTSRFQLGLIATLAIALGFTLASSEAVGYPAGSAVSFHENPVVAIGAPHIPPRLPSRCLWPRWTKT